MKLIIGIGNPDLPADPLRRSFSEASRQANKYQNTRHNVGFMFLDYLAKKTNNQQPTTNNKTNWEFDKKSNSLVSKTKLEKTSIVLAKPQTYVNKSGEAVKKLVKTYNNLIVVHDDLDIPFGNTKISFDKNSGGHKGVESIMKILKTKKFYRLRIGLGTQALAKARAMSDSRRDEFVKNYVLSKFSKSESEKLKEIFKEAYDKLLMLINH